MINRLAEAEAVTNQKISLAIEKQKQESDCYTAACYIEATLNYTISGDY